MSAKRVGRPHYATLERALREATAVIILRQLSFDPGPELKNRLRILEKRCMKVIAHLYRHRAAQSAKL